LTGTKPYSVENLPRRRGGRRSYRRPVAPAKSHSIVLSSTSTRSSASTVDSAASKGTDLPGNGCRNAAVSRLHRMRQRKGLPMPNRQRRSNSPYPRYYPTTNSPAWTGPSVTLMIGSGFCARQGHARLARQPCHPTGDSHVTSHRQSSSSSINLSRYHNDLAITPPMAPAML
jgi:hypothetical protein